MKINFMKLIIIFFSIIILSGCGSYPLDPQINNQLNQSGLTVTQLCNYIGESTTDYNQCRGEITKEYATIVIKFKNSCDEIRGQFNNDLSCNILVYDPLTDWERVAKYTLNSRQELYNYIEKQKYRKSEKYLTEKSQEYNTIQDLCNDFSNTSYDAFSRTCRFHGKYKPAEYPLLEKIVREKDNKVVDEENNIRYQEWVREAKEFKGSLDNLCEYITGKPYEFNEKTLECRTRTNIDEKKYASMKPLLIEQHNKITKEKDELKQKEKQEKILALESFNQKWENRVNKAKQLELGKSYICETNAYGNVKNSIFFNVLGKVKVGENSVDFNGHILYLRDDYISYYLLEGYSNNNYNIIRGKLFKGKGLNNSPYNLEINGMSYFCE